MFPGDIHRFQIHRTSKSGHRKLRVARCETILDRMINGEAVDGAGAPLVSSRCSPKSMKRQFSGKNLWTVHEDDSNRSTLLRKSDLHIASLPASSSPSSDDKSAGKSAVDDDVRVGGGKIKRSTATAAHGVISLMGRRREMEDALTAVPSLAQTLGSAWPHGFFGVYDGHGGFGVAEKCKERLHHLVAGEMVEEIGGSGGLTTMDDVEVGARVDWERVMKMSFARMDREVCGEEGEASGGERRKSEGKTTGSTAVVVGI